MIRCNITTQTCGEARIRASPLKVIVMKSLVAAGAECRHVISRMLFPMADTRPRIADTMKELTNQLPTKMIKKP